MQSARCELCRGHYKDGNSLFKITSAYGGVISILGPSYDELTGNPSVRRDWNLSLKDCVTEDHAKLREANDIFITRILALDDSEIHKSVSSIPSYGWRYSPANRTHISRICYPKSSPSTSPDNGASKWRLFATAQGTVGLVPSSVRKGDKICHFWKSGIVAVIRAEDEWTWRIVGKALLADQEHTKKINKDVTFEVVESDQLAGLYVDIVALFGLTC